MKHPRRRAANAAFLSALTVFSPLQAVGSGFPVNDFADYFFETFASGPKPTTTKSIEKVLKKEFEDFVGSGDYQFFSKETEITWNVWAEGNITGNSVHSKGKDLTLTAEKGSLILTPDAVANGGFGSAVEAGFKTSVQIIAGESIVLNKAQTAFPEDQKDHLSIALGEGAAASLKAKEIILNGSIGWMGAGAQVELKALESVHIALSEQKRNSVHHPLWVFDGSLIIDAPTVEIDRDVSITQMSDQYQSFVQIGMDRESGIETEDVLFNGRVIVGARTSFEANSSNSIAFKKALTIHEGASAQIESRHIFIDELKFHDNGGAASIVVRPEGSLNFSHPVTVKDGAALNISLGENSILTGAVFTDKQSGAGGSFISLSVGSVWQNAMHSNVTELTVSEGAIIEVGSERGLRPLEIQTLKGTGATFYLPGGRAGSIYQTQGGEGVHSVYLGTSGASITETKLVHHVFSLDESHPDAGKAKFTLANNGLVDAGPYQYKLDLQPVDYDDKRVWLITSEKEEKPVSPVLPPDSNGPSENPDVPPSVPGETPSVPPTGPGNSQNPPAPEGLSRTGQTVLSVVSSGSSVVQYLSSLADLRERTGEIRRGSSDGAYVLGRYEKGRFDPYAGVHSKLRYTTVSLGTDKKIDPNWIVGAQVGFTDGDVRVKSGAGKTDIHSIGGKAYLTWFNEDAYVDTVLTFNRHKQKIRAHLMEGTSVHAPYHNLGFGISSEGGMRFNFLKNQDGSSWFIEPQVQLSYYRLLGEDFSFSHGMKVKIDDSDSLNMRLGLTAGRSFNRPGGQNVGNLYVKAGVNHDFLGKTKIRMNEFDFKTRSLGTRFYFGVGGELVIGNQWKAFAQIGGEHGNRLNVDLSCKAGIKYSF